MNRIYYYLQTLNIKIEKLLRRKMDEAAYTKFKTEHGKELSTAEVFNILRDLEKVIYGEMKLSEYVDKRGTIYLDERIQPLLKKERPKNEPVENHGVFERRYKTTKIENQNIRIEPQELLSSTKRSSSHYKTGIILCIIALLGVGGCFMWNTNKKQDSNELYNSRTFATTPQKGNVFVCTSETATKYHNNLKCRGLLSCSDEIKEVELTEAEDMGYEECYYCYH